MRKLFGLLIALCFVVSCHGSALAPADSFGTSIVLQSRDLSLVAGDSTTLGVTLLNGIEVLQRTAATGSGPEWSSSPPTVWKSNDLGIASVTSNGVVTAQSAGAVWLFVQRGTLRDSTLLRVSAARSSLVGARAIAIGGNHTCILDSEAAAWCWGSLWNGATGSGVRLRYSSSVSPSRVRTASRYMNISAGTEHTCAVTLARNVECWGDNRFGQIGSAQLVEATPVPVPLPTLVRRVAVGGDAACALLDDGSVRCWGVGFDRMLSFGPSLFGEVSQLVVGGKHACVVASGVIWCWGDNQSGQLGIGSRTSQPQPVRVSGSIRATAISAGAEHTCMIDETQRALCWGTGFSGQLGLGPAVVSLTPSQVLTTVQFTAISAAGGHTCALTVNGTLYCWGGNLDGALGIRVPSNLNGQAADFVVNQPTKAAPSLAFSMLQTGGGVSCGIAQPGSSLMCWGGNRIGQLGLGEISWQYHRRYSLRFEPAPVVALMP